MPPQQVLTYPVLPPAPTISQGSGAANALTPNNPLRSFWLRRRLTPVGVGLSFVAVQVLLLIRFVLKLVAISVGSHAWVSSVYGISDVFLWPFTALLARFSLPLLSNIELYTLLAIVVYSFISRIVVHILKRLPGSQ
jgi:hypothetical protein